MIDWSLDLVFRRDIAQVGVTMSDGISRSHHEAGDVIFRQGELARNFYVILAGKVEVFRQEDDHEATVATLGPGEYFGEMSLLQGVQHTASVRALTPVDLMVMAGADFTELATSSTRFSELLAGVMRQRLYGSGVAEIQKESESDKQ